MINRKIKKRNGKHEQCKEDTYLALIYWKRFSNWPHLWVCRTDGNLLCIITPSPFNFMIIKSKSIGRTFQVNINC